VRSLCATESVGECGAEVLSASEIWEGGVEGGVGRVPSGPGASHRQRAAACGPQAVSGCHPGAEAARGGREEGEGGGTGGGGRRGGGGEKVTEGRGGVSE